MEDTITAFQDFLEKEYEAELLDRLGKGLQHIILDFARLSLHNPELADQLLESPEEMIRAAEKAIILVMRQDKGFKARFSNLPESRKIMIRNIRSKHLGKFYQLEGIVRQKSDVRPQVTIARFECPSCGNVITVLQQETKFKEPSMCGCGRKGKFKLTGKELIDAQGIVLEEAPEDLEGGEQQKRMNILLKDDLVSPMTDKHTNPGSKVVVVGHVKEIPVVGRDGVRLTRFDLLIEANNIEAVHEDYYDIEISPEEKEKILDIARSPRVYESINNSIAPSIYGYDKIKEAIALQLVGGVKKKRSDGSTTRGDMHVFLIGDPGAGKSQLLKRVAFIAPKARYVSGKGVSGAGLSASVVKDEFLQGWSLEAGALPLCNKGVCAIDELDKMDQNDTAAMHEAMEQQTITIAKANIQATLRAETTVLAAANPKFGRFDPYDIIAKQIDLPPALINRFDLIFAIKDLPDKDKDTKMAAHILSLHKSPDIIEPEIDTQLLKKFISYARQTCAPQLTDEAVEEIQKFYVEMRSTGSEEGSVKSIAISARQLEALVRMAEATAKLRLADKVLKSDAHRAIELLKYSLSEIGIDPATGKIDIDRIATGIPASERNKIFVIKDIIIETEKQFGKKIPVENVEREALARGITKEEFNGTIEKLKIKGDIFEPQNGYIARL